MNSSTSISSSLVAHNELLSTIASLRSQLASTQSALYQAQQQAGASDSAGTSSRSRRTSASNAQYAYANGSSSHDGSQLRSAPPHRRSISGSGSMLTGYPGAPPSSLATTSYSLKRDKSYEDLQSVMSAPSPMSTRKNSLNSSSESNGLGLAKPQTVRRRSSSTSASSEGGLKTSEGSRIPVPAIPKGSVGTAATLAGGGSPKSPLITRSDSNGFVDGDTSFEGSRHPIRPIHTSHDPANGQDELDMMRRGPATSLPPPPSAIPRPVSPPMRPIRSSPGNVADYMEVEERQPRSATVRTSSSPFFGGSAGFTEKHAARVASSQSGTSKVIMSLQTDLTNARTQLESTRVQLRASARAVEALTRQVEDLKEQKERQRLDSQSMATTLSRRERMLEETLSRARGAESQVKQLEDERKSHNAECSRRLKDYDTRLKEAEERKSKAESEYNALKGATNALSEGWKRDVRAYKKEQANLKLLAEKDANAAKARQASTSKLIAGRTSAKQDIDAALQDLSRWQTNIQKQYENQIQQLQKQSAESERENEILRQRTQEVLDELAQYKHAMRTFDPASLTA